MSRAHLPISSVSQPILAKVITQEVLAMSQVIPLGPAARMLTTREAAFRLGVSLRTVQLWVEANILPAARTPGGHRRIPYNAVEALALSMGLDQARSAPQSQAAGQVHFLTPGDPVDTSLVVDARGAAAKMRVVLVSSNPQWLADCVQAMEIFGKAVSVWSADSGYVGLLQIGRQSPDLLVTELELPGMDGFEMLRTLERTESMSNLRVLALTSASPADLRARGGLPASVELLSLPVSAEALAIRVGRWLLTRQSMPGDASG
jgi:excisionase family DNA binding protein